MMRVGLLLLLVGPASAATTTANPIRKVVTLMQNMQKEIEEQGAKEKELFDKFMCYCSGNNGELDKAAADTRAQIDELGAKLKSEEAEKAGTAQELEDHKKDREGATADLEEATMLRGKESAAFDETKADSETNINAMAGAIPSLEKGMGGAALMQMPGSDRLHKIVEAYPNMDPMDRRSALAFLEQSGDYVPQSGQIVGILKAMKDEMEASLKEAVADEEKSVAGFAELKASKEKEVEMATEAIETKMSRAGSLAVSVVQTKDALEDATVELADTEKFANQLKSQCATKEGEWAERSKLRNDEIAAISEAINILNDDDALDVFKKALPSSLVQTETGFLQRASGRATRALKAQVILAGVAAQYKDAPVRLALYTLQSKLRLKSAGGFDEVVKMVDDMVVLLGKQQKEDDKQNAWCAAEFDKSADEEAGHKSKLASVEASMAEQQDAISTLMEEINTLTAAITDLDKSVADATEQRKEEHQEYVDAMQMNEAAMGLVEKAKNRMQKFYNPTLYKAAPKTERTGEEKIIDAGSFAQVSVHDTTDVAPPPAPETFSGPLAKNEKSAGVIGLMDNIVRDLGNDMKEAENEEKTAQKDYAELMADSQETRAQDSKSLTGKKSTKADTEATLMTTKESRGATSTDLKMTRTYIQDLHASCDFIMQNFDLRKEARGNEVEGLKNAKAVLAGASFSL